MSDRTGPLKQPKRMTRQAIELMRVVLTDRTLQCFDRSAAEIGRVFGFAFGLRLRHGAMGMTVTFSGIRGCSSG